MIAVNMPNKAKRSLIMLAIGAFTGLIFSVSNITLLLGKDTLDIDAIARVNDRYIRTTDYPRAVDLVSAEQRGDNTPMDLQMILDKLIDEELLMQHAVKSGLLRSNPDIRQRTLQTLLDTINSTSSDSETASQIQIYVEQLRQSATIEQHDQQRSLLVSPERAPK